MFYDINIKTPSDALIDLTGERGKTFLGSGLPMR
jgi:hypothetical protein